jgi:hypothetical protein
MAGWLAGLHSTDESDCTKCGPGQLRYLYPDLSVHTDICTLPLCARHHFVHATWAAIGLHLCRLAFISSWDFGATADVHDKQLDLEMLNMHSLYHLLFRAVISCKFSSLGPYAGFSCIQLWLYTFPDRSRSSRKCWICILLPSLAVFSFQTWPTALQTQF